MIPLLLGAYAAAVALAPTTSVKIALSAPVLLVPAAFWISASGKLTADAFEVSTIAMSERAPGSCCG